MTLKPCICCNKKTEVSSAETSVWFFSCKSVFHFFDVDLVMKRFSISNFYLIKTGKVKQFDEIYNEHAFVSLKMI